MLQAKNLATLPRSMIWVAGKIVMPGSTFAATHVVCAGALFPAFPSVMRRIGCAPDSGIAEPAWTTVFPADPETIDTTQRALGRPPG